MPSSIKLREKKLIHFSVSEKLNRGTFPVRVNQMGCIYRRGLEPSITKGPFDRELNPLMKELAEQFVSGTFGSKSGWIF